ncbi:MAG: hypothetical protein NTY02_09820 [Acidobacteria bacterium]|nr:hypothetical protein [Acidobacteriota bacterium]
MRVPRAFFREGRRLLVRAMHVLGSRTLFVVSADWTDPGAAVPGAPIQTAAATRLYRAVVAFQDGGRGFEVLARMRSTVQIYPTGTKVDVVYPRGQPGRAQLRPELADFWSQASVLLMATILGAGTAYGWWTSTRRRAARRRRVVKAGR